MHYHIYCNEKSLSANYVDAIAEFQKRLSAYCETTLHTQTALTFPKDLNSNNHDFIFVHSGHSTYSSEEFADYLNTLLQSGKSTLHIVIGFSETDFYNALGSFTGNSLPTRLSLTNARLSNETQTLLFYEQLYRGYTILQGKTYHK